MAASETEATAAAVVVVASSLQAVQVAEVEMVVVAMEVEDETAFPEVPTEAKVAREEMVVAASSLLAGQAARAATVAAAAAAALPAVESLPWAEEAPQEAPRRRIRRARMGCLATRRSSQDVSQTYRGRCPPAPYDPSRLFRGIRRSPQ